MYIMYYWAHNIYKYNVFANNCPKEMDENKVTVG